MRITVSRSGGYAGLEEELGRLDTGSGDTEQAADIERRVREARFFDLPAEIPVEHVGADLFRYSVTVIDGGRAHTVTYSDGGERDRELTGPHSALRGLVDAVIRLR